MLCERKDGNEAVCFCRNRESTLDVAVIDK